MSDEIPQTAAEAERTLWHALDHLRGDVVTYRVRQSEAACMVLRAAIDRVIAQQDWDETISRAIAEGRLPFDPRKLS